jgi:hypothetical protein
MVNKQQDEKFITVRKIKYLLYKNQPRMVWFMVFYATFNNISVIVVVSFIGKGNRITLEKTTDLSQVTDKLYHI